MTILSPADKMNMYKSMRAIRICEEKAAHPGLGTNMKLALEGIKNGVGNMVTLGAYNPYKKDYHFSKIEKKVLATGSKKDITEVIAKERHEFHDDADNGLKAEYDGLGL